MVSVTNSMVIHQDTNSTTIIHLFIIKQLSLQHLSKLDSIRIMMVQRRINQLFRCPSTVISTNNFWNVTISSASNIKNETTHVVGTCLPTLMSKHNHYVVWVLDSGASNHVSYNHSLFVNLRPTQNKLVSSPSSDLVYSWIHGWYHLPDRCLLAWYIFHYRICL